MKPETIAIFDFDGTITTKDTFLEFIKFSKGKKQFYIGFLIFSPFILAMKLKLYPNWKAKEKLFSFFFKGISEQLFNNWCKRFRSEIENIVRPLARETIKSHIQSRNKIVIISASIENWITPWAKKTGFESVLATKIEVDENGFLTGKFLTKNCYGQEKVDRLLEKYPFRNEYNFIAYGDSHGDKELISFADDGSYNKFK